MQDTTTRPHGFFLQNADKKVDETMKQFAIRNCPKTCGYCCLTPAFNCDNKKHPRITCALVTKEMCTDPLWKPIIAEDCPKACGNCADKATSCSVALCKHIDLQDFVKENCRKTCDLCEEKQSSTSTIATAITTALPAGCGDDARCRKWKANGFCTNSQYTKEMIMRTCGRSCGLC
ncbi:unnamed protein product [Cylicocyclus nassatus]|uniref:ShKT domain-containing protein n=1 Tax=Cylicocyclus nassatus TaxID=53992 RepID=A0AA36H1D6_CYLNA|nr:unnamed protein product [Cylicocyclus nassatus]